jgi:hypothetical protein
MWQALPQNLALSLHTPHSSSLLVSSPALPQVAHDVGAFSVKEQSYLNSSVLEVGFSPRHARFIEIFSSIAFGVVYVRICKTR